ncbi:MAG: MFS transporter [Rhodospirillaceae bacterium]|nr:MFS transporter [Rhodospirillaceae bacterium]MDE0616378.1 MFS transporter [Rhodospirillaceae bacterium]
MPKFAPLTVPLWLLITCGCLIGAISFGSRAGMGLYMNDISVSFFDNQTAILSLSLAIQHLVWGAAAPFAGTFADKYGAGKSLALGTIVYAAGLALIPHSTAPIAMHVTAGVLIGVGVAFASFTIVVATFGRKVTPERRSLAFGVGIASGSVGQLVLVPLAAYLIDAYGWQTSLYILACLLLAIVPLTLAVTGKGAPEAGQPDQTAREAFAEALGYRSYLLLCAGFFVCGFHVAFIQSHLPKHLQDADLPLWVGGVSLSLIAAFNLIGTFGAGWLGGKFSKRGTLSAIYFLRAAVIAVFILTPLSVWSVYIFSAFLGLLWLSTVPLTTGLVAQFFGMQYMSGLFGVVFFGHQIGGFLGVYLGGILYDASGSYEVVWWMGVALGVLAALIHLPIKEAPVPRPTVATAAS